jgi:hypothetical protein
MSYDIKNGDVRYYFFMYDQPMQLENASVYSFPFLISLDLAWTGIAIYISGVVPGAVYWVEYAIFGTIYAEAEPIAALRVVGARSLSVSQALVEFTSCFAKVIPG